MKLIILSTIFGSMPAFAEAADRPNIVILCADDLGFGDSGTICGESFEKVKVALRYAMEL